MSSDDKSEYSVGPEKASNDEECKKQVEIFRGYPILESIGVVIDFNKIKPVFIDRETLEQHLSYQEAVIVIPLGKGNKADDIVYYVGSTNLGKGSANVNDGDVQRLRLENDAGCDCSDARDLKEKMNCDCVDIGGEFRCQCSFEGKITHINVCG